MCIQWRTDILKLRWRTETACRYAH